MNEYEHVFVGGAANAYLFKTTHGVFYEVRFKPTPYLFNGQPDVADDTFELVIEIVQAAPGKSPADLAIPLTIAAICRDFFRQRNRIVVYICDTSDGRQSVRVRKFNTWFSDFSDYQFFKLDTQFPDVGGLIHHVSLILRWDHPHLHTVISAFEKLSKSYRNDK